MLNYPGVFGYCVLLLLALNNAEIAVTVALTGSFRLQIFPKTLDNPINCTLTNPQHVSTNIPLDYQPGDSQTGDNQKIIPLGNNQCGVRIHNASSTDVGRWTLSLLNVEEKSVTETFRIRTITLVASVNTTSTAVIGDSGRTILCGPSSMLYCELKDPLGNVVTLSSRTRCETILNKIKTTDIGIWTCTVGVSGITSEIHATHTLNMGEPLEEVVIFSNKTSLGTLISWQVYRIIPAASWCRAFPPNGRSILVLPGLEVDKYISAGTDYTENKCGLLINGEFPEEYNGIWRLEMGLTSGSRMGGFIRMPEGKIPEVDDPVTSEVEPSLPRTSEIIVAVGSPFTITCQTQYPAGYCWIRGPQGQMITSSADLSVGRCSHTISQAVLNDHNGTWTCNMAHINGGHEEHVIIRVNVIDKLYRAVNPEVTVSRGDKVVISCRSVFNYPLQYCRFVRPDGRGLGVAPGMEPSGRYSYEGPGFIYGYCGLAISSVEAQDFGEWRCASRSLHRSYDSENWDTSLLLEQEISVASVIGLSLGAVLLVVIVAGAFVVHKRLNRHWRVEMCYEISGSYMGCRRLGLKHFANNTRPYFGIVLVILDLVMSLGFILLQTTKYLQQFG